MLIAVDIDEVLADTLNAFISIYNKTYQTAFKREQFVTFDWWLVVGLPLEQFKIRFIKLMDEGFFDNLHPIIGSVEGINKLKNRHELIAVTARAQTLQPATEKWLNKYYGSVFRGVYYTRSMPFGPEEKSKYMICEEQGARILLEDQFNYAADCAANGIKVYLFNAPWNQDIGDRPDIIRIYSWAELMNML